MKYGAKVEEQLIHMAYQRGDLLAVVNAVRELIDFLDGCPAKDVRELTRKKLGELGLPESILGDAPGGDDQ